MSLASRSASSWFALLFLPSFPYQTYVVLSEAESADRRSSNGDATLAAARLWSIAAKWPSLSRAISRQPGAMLSVCGPQ